VRITLDPNRIEDYRAFLKIKSLPRFHFEGRVAVVPDEYAALFGGQREDNPSGEYMPILGLFDYQRDIAAKAIRKAGSAAWSWTSPAC
jgi:hypothetical protein